ncbi:MAG TPA: CCA tRNA nucleotidyltransferase, partial [Abditibacteriaceae bacterium]|nr:CCA tRNA nucleotidyltransferase [Abditibacteriaceae bacterium]
MSSSPNRVLDLQSSIAQTPLFRKVREVARVCQSRGGRALIVGGWVRDALLGLSPKDADVEVYGLQPEELRRALQKLGRVGCVGESFRVYKLTWHEDKVRYELDVSIPRRDRKTSDGHKGFEIEGDPFASVEDAARRRDFTINAILCDPLSGEITDPFDGQRDLENRTLRAVDATHFGEDSLRILRAMQFAARFDLSVDEQTTAICRAIDLRDLPRERVWGEWEKLLLNAQHPSRGLLVAQQLRVLEQLFPYLETALQRRSALLCSSLDGAAQEQNALDKPRQIALMLATIGSFLGWKNTKQFLDDLNIWTLDGYDIRKNVVLLVGERKRARDWFRVETRGGLVSDKEFRWLSARVQPRLVYHLNRARGDIEAAEWFWNRVRELGVEDEPPAPLLMGRHLLEMGLKPGPQIGQITQTVYAAQLAGDVSTLDEAKECA